MGRHRKPRPGTIDIHIGFDTKTLTLRLDQIVPLKVVSETALKSVKFLQIKASVQEVGIIEPLIVSASSPAPGRYTLLDGHLRLEVLRTIGEAETTCLVSSDDESYTYNKHISRLSTIMEHKMITKAVARGISEEKIAKALNVDVGNIVRKKNLLNGICPEAIDGLKDKMIAIGVFEILRKMKPFRQIEATGLMNAADLYSVSYAKALLAATQKAHLIDPDKPKKIKGLDDDQMAKMEHEMESLQRDYQLIEESYGADVLNLTLAKGYLGGLLGNSKVVRYLAQHHAEILAQFQKILEMTSLGGKEPAI